MTASQGATPLGSKRVTTRRGIEGEIRVGGSGPDLVWFHGTGGIGSDEALLTLLTASYTVHAPIWPGYGVDETETEIETMLEFALHGWDLVDALGLDSAPILAGHSMGAMIAAEMATLAPRDLRELILLAPAGLWDDDFPVPDIFAMLPFEMAEVLFHDPIAGEKILTAGSDFGDDKALGEFMVNRARQLGTAGKILFPIPNRGIARRLYRITAPTRIIWGESDRLYPPHYADLWTAAIADAGLSTISKAGHMLGAEQPEAVAVQMSTE